jgi:cytoskeletal protein RodZ
MPLDETAMSSAPRPERTLDLDDARKRAGISLDEIADSTKISVRFLKAIEAEEFDKLPGGIFTTSYLRQYAVAIGYDADELLAHYRRKTNLQPAAQPVRQPASASGSRLDRWLRTAQASR